ncbi:MAG: hypothetical protein ACKVZH_20385 [Blastocatellia bacterium]
MAKAQEKNEKGSKDKTNKADKTNDALVGRVKKVVKKSRRKLGDEKFEKQLQRTIAFLEGLQGKLDKTSKPEKEPKPKTQKARPKTKPKSTASK